MTYLLTCADDLECKKVYPADLDECPHCHAPAYLASAAPMNPRDYVYDIETYPNIFSCAVTHPATGHKWRFEVSDRKNDMQEFIDFLHGLRTQSARMVGYNNLHFDYPVIHFIMSNPWVGVNEIYQKAMSIIQSNDAFAHTIWPRDRYVEQLDLYKIHHFDNKAKRTALKVLEFNMNMRNITDLPYKPGTVLNDAEKDVLLNYGDHDVEATCRFYARSQVQINLREKLTATIPGQNFMNDSDVKIGEKILIAEMEKRGIQCYDQSPTGGRIKRQTHRSHINLADAIFPYVRFERPEFQAVKDYLAGKVITETKGVFTGLHTPVDGLEYHFGTGGLHASVESQIVASDDQYQIVDVDVASYYPNLAIMNQYYPEHLGPAYCDAYLGVYHTRQTYPKELPENGAFKLALNGSFGGSNNEYSPFFDPLYTMKTTINGQLLLCMLAEQLTKVPGLKMIQCNTDGVTYLCPREYLEHTRAVCKWWEQLTCLELEEALYSRMFIRDVNSYIAEYEGGKLKRIGAYAHKTVEEDPGTRELAWHKDWSSLVVPKAAEAALVRGQDIRTFIQNHPVARDFMIRAKVPRSNKLVMRWPEWQGAEIELQQTSRVFVSKAGGQLLKVAPPTQPEGTWKRRSKITDQFFHQVMSELRTNPPGPETPVDTAGTPWDERIHTKNQSVHTIREMGICTGWRVTECNDMDTFNRDDLNIDYYVREAEKLVNPLRGT